MGRSRTNSINSLEPKVEIDDYETRQLIPSEPKEIKAKGEWISARHALALWAFFGFFNVYCLRVNLSVALVAMVNSTHSSSDNASLGNECPDPQGVNSTSNVKEGEFNWDASTQGLVLGSFFYGYICTQLPGGWLAGKFGGKNLFGYGVFCTAALTLVTPIAARYSVYLFIAVRVLEGIGEGVTFPAMHAIWGNWAPRYERSKLASFSYAGAQLGTVFSMPISGYLCDSDFLGGWPSVFYIFGTLGCLWFVGWMFLVHNTPEEHPRISPEEKAYIENSIGKKEKYDTPWKQIFTSPALLGITVAHFSNNWGFYTLLTCLPTYMKNVLRFDMKTNGLLSALPYFVCWCFQNTSGLSADYLRSHGYMSTKNARKMFNTLGMVVPAGALVIVGYVGCDHVLAVVFLTLSVGFGGCTMGGYNINHLDIAPKFAGVLMGITNMVATIPGFVGPEIVGQLTNDNQSRGQWQIVFYITGSIYLFGAVVYLMLAQGEELWWSVNPPSGAKGHAHINNGEGDNPEHRRTPTYGT